MRQISDDGFDSRVRGGAPVAVFRIPAPQLAVEVNALQRSIDHGFEFVRVLHLAAFS
jgi:hypothetical protein